MHQQGHERRRSLENVQLPRLSPGEANHLARQGWAPVLLGSPEVDPLTAATHSLINACSDFFDQDTTVKKQHESSLGSEEGWTGIPGEKQFIALRTRQVMPPQLRRTAEAFWAIAGALMNDLLGSIAQSLGLPPGSLSAYSRPSSNLDDEQRSTMLRIFRYETREAKVVAEGKRFGAKHSSLNMLRDQGHKDLGLLSLVVGDSPGLEVGEVESNRWLAIERAYTVPCATLLVGRELERLSNGRYVAGSHLVRAYEPEVTAASPLRILAPGNTESANEVPSLEGSHTAPPGPPPGRYRHSIVYVCRSHWPVPIDTDLLTTAVTGPFKRPLQAVAQDLFEEIKGKHFNINANMQLREEQRQNLQARKQKQSNGMKSKATSIQTKPCKSE